MIEYRPVDIPDYETVTDLEIDIWQTTEREAIDAHTLRVIVHTGGCLIGAYDGDKLIGFVVAFAMHDPDRLWSHIAAIHPDYQRQGIGTQLKYEQRDWALDNGYSIMHWTFDPTMQANAHFNLRMLGATCNTYHPNFYGDMDGINAGLPTDRFQVTWDLTSTKTRIPAKQDIQPLLVSGFRGIPVKHGILLEDEWYRVEIPYRYTDLKQHDMALALEWKMNIRKVFMDAFEQGYTAVDFVRSYADMTCWYVLQRTIPTP